MSTDKPRRILVVDDEADLEHLLLRRMRRELRGGRYEFVFARDGFEALAKLREDPAIELVLSDINMPRMDGLTLLEQLGHLDLDIRAVVVSAYDDMENIRTAMNRGAFDFVTKPIDFGDLKATIDKTLDHVEKVREALLARDRLVALQQELDMASRIQQSILPRGHRATPGYRLHGDMIPARDVGGDFYDVTELRDGRLGLTIADVSDRGVPAALFMMSTRSLLRGAAHSRPGPAEVLDTVNTLLEAENEAGMFLTVFHAMLEPQSGELQYVNAGHTPPLVVRPDGTSTVLPGTGGVPLGAVSGFSYGQAAVTLAPGETAVLYTDGVTEARNPAGEKFGVGRLREALAERAPVDPPAVSAAIFEGVRRFTGDAPQHDDIACLVLAREAPAT